MPLRDFCRLRPMQTGDRDRIHRWRNEDRIRSVMFNTHPITPSEHARWFQSALEDSKSCYLVFEFQGRPVGVVNFPKMDDVTRSCRWGFYMGETDVPKGTSDAMGYLGLEHAFDTLSMQLIIGETLLHNQRAIRFHQRLGFEQTKATVSRLGERDVKQDVVEFRLTHTQWKQQQPHLLKQIFVESETPVSQAGTRKK